MKGYEEREKELKKLRLMEMVCLRVYFKDLAFFPCKTNATCILPNTYLPSLVSPYLIIKVLGNREKNICHTDLVVCGRSNCNGIF